MNFKSLVSFMVAILLAFTSGEVLAGSKMCYFWVGYLAQPAPYQYQHVFEKKIIKVKASADSSAATAKVREQYVAFVKEHHPEYYEQYVTQTTDPQARDFKITSLATVDGCFEKEKDARQAMESAMADYKHRYEQNPQNGPVVVVDEFVFVD